MGCCVGTKDFREVASVNLVNNKNVLALTVCFCPLAELVENTFDIFESIPIRLVSADKVLVGIILMELYKLNLFRVLKSNQTGCKSLCRIGLTDAGRTLEDDVLFCLNDSDDSVVLLGSHKDLRQEVLF